MLKQAGVAVFRGAVKWAERGGTFSFNQNLLRKPWLAAPPSRPGMWPQWL